MSDRITVIHAPRDSEHKYFALRRAVPQDGQLSFEARGVLAYLLSKPDDWVVRIQDLMREGRCGRDRIYRMLGELKDKGYLHRDQVHKPDGTFGWGPYRVYEIPFTEKADVAEPQQEAAQPFTEKPYTVKPYTENTEMVKRKEPQQEAAQPFTPLPYTENPHAYRIERGTDQREIQKRESGATDQKPARTPAYSPAVERYFVVYPAERLNAKQIAEIDRRITGDLPRWQRALDYWSANGFNAQRVGKICDRYDEEKAGTNGRPPPPVYTPPAGPRGTPEEMAAAAKNLNPFAKREKP